MPNELVLLLSIVITYGSVLVFYRILGKSGLFVWSAIATIVANIEVSIMIDAFGANQTLGNVLFASTFLVTDILSENYDKKVANKAVKIGILANIVFILLSRLWFMYTPAENDYIMPSIQEVFANTPRFMIVGVLVFAICQVFDVWIYHVIWSKTTKIFGNKKAYLFIRNNGSTLISQFINAVLFSFCAFWGTFDLTTIINITISSYIIFIATSLLDTPFVYLARKFRPSEKSEV